MLFQAVLSAAVLAVLILAVVLIVLVLAVVLVIILIVVLVAHFNSLPFDYSFSSKGVIILFYWEMVFICFRRRNFLTE